MSEKVCKQCGQSKPLNSDNYHANASSPDGYRAVCKVCRAEAAAANVKPTREADESDAAYDNRIAHWRINNDMQAANEIRDDLKNSPEKRLRAKGTIRRLQREREALQPQVSVLSGIAFAPDAPATTPASEDNNTFDELYAEWKNPPQPCDPFRRWMLPDLMRSKDPVRFAEWEAEELAADRIRRPYHYPDLRHASPEFGGSITPSTVQERINRAKALTPDMPEAPEPAPVISPLPAAAPMLVLQMLVDGWQCTTDGKSVEGMDLTNAEILRCGAPKDYVPGSKKFPPGVYLDIVDMMWRKR